MVVVSAETDNGLHGDCCRSARRPINVYTEIATQGRIKISVKRGLIGENGGMTARNRGFARLSGDLLVQKDNAGCATLIAQPAFPILLPQNLL